METLRKTRRRSFRTQQVGRDRRTAPNHKTSCGIYWMERRRSSMLQTPLRHLSPRQPLPLQLAIVGTLSTACQCMSFIFFTLQLVIDSQTAEKIPVTTSRRWYAPATTDTPILPFLPPPTSVAHVASPPHQDQFLPRCLSCHHRRHRTTRPYRLIRRVGLIRFSDRCVLRQPSPKSDKTMYGVMCAGDFFDNEDGLFCDTIFVHFTNTHIIGIELH